MTTVQVGSVVRAPRANGTKFKGRAVVALKDDDTTACILWEDLAPRPLNNTAPFIVTPMVPRSKEEREDTVGVSELLPLLEFEQQVSSSDDEMSVSVAEWKERGDTLLRLGDASAAIPFYEAGLAASSVLQVGGTGLVPLKDEYQVAEVDYLEDGNADVTMGDEERTIPESDVKLCLMPGDEALQVRILLNLARCLMQVGELEQSQMSAYYRRSAATACSMALAILTAIDEDTESLHATALLLRSKAYASRSKWKMALADAETLIRDHPDHKEGRKWAPQLDSQVAQQQKTNQKLAKSMCAWVQNATTTTETSSEDGKEPSSSVSQVRNEEQGSSSPSNAMHRQSSPLTLFWYLLFPLLLAFCIHRLLSSQAS
jgi:tetratricopeptide (TPR) repeat protein